MYIEKVKFLKNFIIEIILNDKYTYFYDFKPLVKSIRFGKIRTQENFEQGRLVDGCRIVWDGGEVLEDYEIFGFEIYESNLYIHSKEKYMMLAEA